MTNQNSFQKIFEHFSLHFQTDVCMENISFFWHSRIFQRHMLKYRMSQASINVASNFNFYLLLQKSEATMNSSGK